MELKETEILYICPITKKRETLNDDFHLQNDTLMSLFLFKIFLTVFFVTHFKCIKY